MIHKVTATSLTGEGCSGPTSARSTAAAANRARARGSACKFAAVEGCGWVGLGEARGVQGFAPNAPGSRHTGRGKDAQATLVVFREGTGVDGARGRGTLHTAAVCHGRALQQALCPHARRAAPRRCNLHFARSPRGGNGGVQAGGRAQARATRQRWRGARPRLCMWGRGYHRVSGALQRRVLAPRAGAAGGARGKRVGASKWGVRRGASLADASLSCARRQTATPHNRLLLGASVWRCRGTSPWAAAALQGARGKRGERVEGATVCVSDPPARRRGHGQHGDRLAPATGWRRPPPKHQIAIRERTGAGPLPPPSSHK